MDNNEQRDFNVSLLEIKDKFPKLMKSYEDSRRDTRIIDNHSCTEKSLRSRRQKYIAYYERLEKLTKSIQWCLSRYDRFRPGEKVEKEDLNSKFKFCKKYMEESANEVLLLLRVQFDRFPFMDEWKCTVNEQKLFDEFTRNVQKCKQY